MPTYRNMTNTDITVGAIRFPAKSTMEVRSYVPGTLPAGLLMINVLPNWNPVLLATKFTLKTGATLAPITVPDSNTNSYFISFYVESGEFQIQMNETVYYFGTHIIVTEGQTWGRKYPSKSVNTINIRAITGGTIYVNIYKN